MKFFFLVEDTYGDEFIKQLFDKKLGEGLFSGKMTGARRSPIGPKLAKIIKTQDKDVRIIILADADDKPIQAEEMRISKYIQKEHAQQVRIVLLTYEIEEWICYSRGFKIDDKPSKILERKIQHKKNRLPQYASKIDCAKLTDCQSFKRLVDAMAT